MPSRYQLADFDYEFPPEAVAQHPLPERSASRLLVLERASGTIHHRAFTDFPSMLAAGDVCVRNVSRVIPARLRGQRSNGAPAEILLVHEEPDGTWLAMGHPGGKLKPGRTVRFGSEAQVEIVEVLGGGLRRIRWSGHATPREIMERYGETPLPPYIERPAEPPDRERYQTVFAEVEGSVAAPTAGLHFTRDILRTIAARGIQMADVVLHVGPGTFKSVSADDPADHEMLPEWFAVPAQTVQRVHAAREGRHRVCAIGTTTVRVLETAGRTGSLREGTGWTSLFIYPPFEFRVVDALLTNFHRPRSTLLMLVAAFAGYENTMRAYRAAIEEQYRLFSYGDAMAIL